MPKFFMINDQYNEGIQINEYNGQFSLVTAQMNDGTVYPKWVHPSGGKGKPPNDKVIPMGSPRMERNQLIELAKWILAEMDEEGSYQGPTDDRDDDTIPF